MQAIFLFLLLACILWLICSPEITLDTVLSWTPSSPLLAAGFLLVLHGVKSLTVVIPLMLLQAVTGHLFSPGPALLLNLAGDVIVLILPYLLGRSAGSGLLQKLEDRYPRLRSLVDLQQRNAWFVSFFLRVINCLPGDIISMYLGASGVTFSQNLFAGMVGLLPLTLCATVLGASVSQPGSPAFWISLLLTVILSVVSALFYWIYCKRKTSEK